MKNDDNVKFYRKILLKFSEDTFYKKFSFLGYQIFGSCFGWISKREISTLKWSNPILVYTNIKRLGIFAQKWHHSSEHKTNVRSIITKAIIF